MGMAESAAKPSPDAETKVGAVLISETGRQIASGFNGFLRGAKDKVLPKLRPHKHFIIQHAERNLLYNCLDEGIRTRNCKLICTLAPCEDCLRACYQAGIVCIIYKDDYREPVNYTRLPDVFVQVTKLSNGYTQLDLAEGDLHTDDAVEEYLEELYKKKGL